MNRTVRALGRVCELVCGARGRAAAVSVALLAPSVGCYSLVGRYGAPFYEGDDTRYFDKLIRDRHVDNVTKVLPVLAADTELTVHGAPEAFRATCMAQPAVLRFVWLSDVQMRQREVKLFSSSASSFGDNFVPTFERNEAQEEYDWAVYLSYVIAINRLDADIHAPDVKPAFMIHTGDSADAGTIEELYQFVSISNRLTIPWLNVVGNHDTSLFGNYEKRIGYTLNAGVEFYPVASRRSFLWMHRSDRTIAGFGVGLLPIPDDDGVEEQFGKRIPKTLCHGFDLDVIPRGQPGECERERGDYAFDVPTLPIRVVVLDSTKKSGWGADGELLPYQLDWLKKRIDEAGSRVVFLFSHHEPESLKGELEVLSQVATGKLVFFTAHTHQHHFIEHDLPHGKLFEMNTGSILEYPQLGRVIEVRAGSGATCVVSRALWPSYIAETAEAMQKAPTNLDYAATAHECVAKRDEIRLDLKRSAQCGHIGALADYVADRRRAWGIPEDRGQAWREANAVFPIDTGGTSR